MDPEKRKRRIEFIIIIAVLLFIIGLTSFESNIYHVTLKVPISKNALVFSFINLNIVLITLFLFLVIRNTAKFVFGEKQVFGRLKVRAKLAMAFIFFSIIPIIIMFIISAGFITHTINSWFSIEVENSLTQSLDIAKTYYENTAKNTISFASTIGNDLIKRGILSEETKPELTEFITKKLNEYNLTAIEVYDENGKLLGISKTKSGIPINLTKTSMIHDALAGDIKTYIESIGSSDIIKGFAPIYIYGIKQPIGLVVCNYFVKNSLVEKMADIQQGYKEYRQQQILKPHLKTSYILFLVLISLLMIFSSIWLSVYIAKNISVQLDGIVLATKRIMTNDFDVQIEKKSQDEVGDLVDAFNIMAKELKQSRAYLDHSYTEQTQRKAYIEAILNSISSGVIAIDGTGYITMINTTAIKLLNITSSIIDKYYRDVMPYNFISPVTELLREMRSSKSPTATKEISIDLQGQIRIFILRLTALKAYAPELSGYIAVFEDVTDLIKMQRIATWQEVAKRMAHEIKNPLTPIRLAAERLRRKYMDRIDSDRDIFDESTKTIIKEVDELKRLVDEFYTFARLPTSQPKMNSINALITEVYTLYSEAHKNVTFIIEKDEDIPLFKFDIAQMRRVLINLIENALWSIQGTGGITLVSKYDKEHGIAKIEVIDTGMGIEDTDKSKIFDLYYSKKKGGSGLGLAIVQRIITEHNARIRVEDNKPRGAKFTIELSTADEKELFDINGGKIA
ncbi:MAG: ATP-binding protein [Deltaproteobacteria bacterium]|nr:ATP-binding protein [Deltaproteobacteria bacterium]MCL5792543.1 ATP-binding protein [Deltaproteobacteria bacterium]